MARKSMYFAVLILAAAFSQGCATIMHGSTQNVMVTSSPPGATVVVDGGMRFKSPVEINLSRKENHTVELSLDGYQKELVEVRSVTSGAVFGNIVAGGLVGWAVDSSSGGAYRLVPEVIKIDLRPMSAESKSPAKTEVKTTESPASAMTEVKAPETQKEPAQP